MSDTLGKGTYPHLRIDPQILRDIASDTTYGSLWTAATTTTEKKKILGNFIHTQHKTATINFFNGTSSPGGTTIDRGSLLYPFATKVDALTTIAAATGVLPTDTTAPVITLLGSSSIVVKQNSTYTDAGATASDNVDGDITSNIVVVDNVDTSVETTYTITYNVMDSSNNAATQVTRTVIVDGTNPIISVTNGTDTVKLGTSWTDAGATADGGETVTVSGTVDINTEGTYTITYSATDAVGNTGTATRTVIVDGTNPIISVTNGTDTVAQGTSWTDAGATADGGETVTASGTVNINTPGTYTITYSATDAAGNTGTATRIVTVSAPAAKNITLEYVAGSGTTADPERLDVYLDPSTLANGVNVGNIDIVLTASSGGTSVSSGDWLKGNQTAPNLFTNTTNVSDSSNNVILNNNNADINSIYVYEYTFDPVGPPPPSTTYYYNIGVNNGTISLLSNGDSQIGLTNLQEINNTDAKLKLFHVDFTNISINDGTTFSLGSSTSIKDTSGNAITGITLGASDEKPLPDPFPVKGDYKVLLKQENKTVYFRTNNTQLTSIKVFFTGTSAFTHANNTVGSTISGWSATPNAAGKAIFWNTNAAGAVQSQGKWVELYTLESGSDLQISNADNCSDETAAAIADSKVYVQGVTSGQPKIFIRQSGQVIQYGTVNTQLTSIKVYFTGTSAFTHANNTVGSTISSWSATPNAAGKAIFWNTNAAGAVQSESVWNDLYTLESGSDLQISNVDNCSDESANAIADSNVHTIGVTSGTVSLEKRTKKRLTTKGDLNGDSSVTGADVVYLASYIAGLSGFDASNTATADLNSDGSVTGADVVYLASYIAGLSGFDLPSLPSTTITKTAENLKVEYDGTDTYTVSLVPDSGGLIGSNSTVFACTAFTYRGNHNTSLQNIATTAANSELLLSGTGTTLATNNHLCNGANASTVLLAGAQTGFDKLHRVTWFKTGETFAASTDYKIMQLKHTGAGKLIGTLELYYGDGTNGDQKKYTVTFTNDATTIAVTGATIANPPPFRKYYVDIVNSQYVFSDGDGSSFSAYTNPITIYKRATYIFELNDDITSHPFGIKEASAVTTSSTDLFKIQGGSTQNGLLGNNFNNIIQNKGDKLLMFTTENYSGSANNIKYYCVNHAFMEQSFTLTAQATNAGYSALVDSDRHIEIGRNIRLEIEGEEIIL